MQRRGVNFPLAPEPQGWRSSVGREGIGVQKRVKDEGQGSVRGRREAERTSG